MLKRKEQGAGEHLLALAADRWKLVAFGAWLIFCAWFVYGHWTDIQTFDLGDTDDNMRMMQVRALLHGQDWFDLRQYRLNPPFGANMHWSHVVDLPIAGLILLLRQFVGGPTAELIAVAAAPLIPYLVLLFGLALTARRLVDPRAFVLALVAMSVAGATNGMFAPDRIDHHGWQLALLAVSVAGLADPKQLRGGIVLGISTALSMAIGLELVVYLAVAGAAIVLFWVDDRDQRRRLLAYSVSFGGSVALSFLVFASYANRLAVCDALSPVWLSDGLLACALLFGLAFYSPPSWKARLGLAVAAGIIVAGFHALAWPQCLGRPEHVSPEVYSLWLSHVREARPVYANSWRIAALLLGLPITGLIGWALLAWRNRVDRDLFRRTLAAAAPALASVLLLFWQTRAGPAAQMLAVVGAISIVWILWPIADNIRNPVLRTLCVILVAITGLGAIVPASTGFIPSEKASARQIEVNKANHLCNLIYSFHPIALLPKGVVFTFVDSAPRLITVTHHDSIMGPYHRNGEQIADVMKAFRGSAEQAHAIIVDKYHSDYLLTCPDASTTTIFMSEKPKGFYGQLSRGDVPSWLTPIELPKNSPFKMWKVKR